MLSVNCTLSFENRVYQLAAASRNYSPASRKVHVRRYLDGELHMFYRGDEIGFQEINPKTTTEKKPPPPGAKPAAASGSRLPFSKTTPGEFRG